ncbi:ImcF-related family protein, partial [Glaciimonas soli]
SGERVVQSALPQNADLVQQARAFLADKPANQRLYQRTMAAMPNLNQQDFTLARAVGPQANSVFTLASGNQLTKGIPGIFTYAGYHTVFDPRLTEFVRDAQLDDAWVMGKSIAPLSDKAKEFIDDDPITKDIRSQYLQEYTQRWTAFLDDIRTVTGKDLKADVKLLSMYAAPDAPLSRLAKAAARETTLSRKLVIDGDNDRDLLDKASDTISKSSRAMFGVGQSQLEKELVDSHFAALRQVVTGETDAGQSSTAAPIPGLAAINGLLNAYFTSLLVADSALSSNGLPPDNTEVSRNLIQAADAAPAPFKTILSALVNGSTQKIGDGASIILRKQAQEKLDRVNQLMAQQVSNPCQSGIAGHYPFAASVTEVAIDDFKRMFAAGGAADSFFQQQLAPFVETSSRPWRYINPATATTPTPAQAAILGITASNDSAPSTNNSPTLLSEYLKLLTQQGPNPDFFAHAKAIREAYFQNPGSQTVAWKTNVSVTSLDPTIVELYMNFDGQAQRYVHGPVEQLPVNWPGAYGGTSLELTANPRISVPTSTIYMRGAWAMQHLMEQGKRIGPVANGKVTMEFSFDTRKAVLEFDSG